MFKYTKYLEAQILEQKTRIKELEGRNDRLVEALVPILRKMNEPKIEVAHSTPAITHQITKDAVTATCSCGWTIVCHDPGALQEQISDHYRTNTSNPMKRGRKSWGQVRTMLEQDALLETNKEEIS